MWEVLNQYKRNLVWAIEDIRPTNISANLTALGKKGVEKEVTESILSTNLEDQIATL
jgi:hypothetical protein